MALVDQTVLARQRGDATQVAELSRAAFHKESSVANQFELEPTRSILHRSAMSYEKQDV